MPRVAVVLSSQATSGLGMAFHPAALARDSSALAFHFPAPPFAFAATQQPQQTIAASPSALPAPARPC